MRKKLKQKSHKKFLDRYRLSAKKIPGKHWQLKKNPGDALSGVRKISGK